MPGAGLFGKSDQVSETAKVNLVAAGTRRIGARLEDVRMGIGMPQRSRDRHRELCGLEMEEAKMGGLTRSSARTRVASSRSRAIGRITPQPFPGETSSGRRRAAAHNQSHRANRVLMPRPSSRTEVSARRSVRLFPHPGELRPQTSSHASRSP